LVKVSKNKSKRGALATNYKLLINFFWNMQKKIDPEFRIIKDQSQNSMFG